MSSKASAPRRSGHARQFVKDWKRLERSDRYPMQELKDVMQFLIENRGPDVRYAIPFRIRAPDSRSEGQVSPQAVGRGQARAFADEHQDELRAERGANLVAERNAENKNFREALDELLEIVRHATEYCEPELVGEYRKKPASALY